VLTSYDGSRDHMRRIVETMFINPRIRNDQFYVDRRHQLSLEPGAWECVAAARFKRPGVVPQAPSPSAYGNIRVPTLIVAGAKDTLRDPGYGELLQAEIAGSKLVVFPESGHCPQIDEAEEFNKVVIDFLMSSSD
jgi:pimeloyl-ACP methyl ester carboxylesterase